MVDLKKEKEAGEFFESICTAIEDALQHVIDLTIAKLTDRGFSEDRVLALVLIPLTRVTLNITNRLSDDHGVDTDIMLAGLGIYSSGVDKMCDDKMKEDQGG